MNITQIESLKSTLTELTKQGCTIQYAPYQISGKVIGVGFKPYWSNPTDSKIDKLEFDFVDHSGAVRPLYFHNILGYDIVSFDGDTIETSKNMELDIHVYSPLKPGSSQPYEKARISIKRT